MKNITAIPPAFDPTQGVNTMDGIHAEIYLSGGEPVAAVIWRGADPQPFLAIMDSTSGGITRFSVTANDDVPKWDSKQTHMNARVEVLTKNGDFAGVALAKEGEGAPSMYFVGEKDVVEPKPTPSPEQLAALGAFREKYGRNWKSKLQESWMSGNYPSSMNNNAGLLQQVRNQLGPVWLSKHAEQVLARADSAAPQKRDMVIFMTFTSHDVTPHLQSITESAAHIPKYWAVSDAERQQMTRLFVAPTVVGSSVRFEAAMEGTDEEMVRLADLVQELGKKCNDKDFITAGEKVHCIVAIGGFKEDVVAQAHELIQRSRLPKAESGEAGPQPKSGSVVSVFRENWDSAARAAGTPKSSNIEFSRLPLGDDALVDIARQYNISEISSPTLADQFIWFKSRAVGADEQQRSYTLHVHEVDGREPTAQDYAGIAQKLGIDLQADLESEYTIH